MPGPGAALEPETIAAELEATDISAQRSVRDRLRANGFAVAWRRTSNRCPVQVER